MKKLFIAFAMVCSAKAVFTQPGYQDSLQKFFTSYVNNHEVVTAENRKFIQFFSPDPAYRVVARFEKAKNSSWFQMETLGREKKLYRVYGTLSFVLQTQPVTLNLYQSQTLLEDPELKDYLLLPFTDETSGKETYHGGRYLDFTINDVKKNTVVIDFNKAYNPYCAYEEDKYNCPIPPKENHIPIALKAGEKNFVRKQ